MTNCIAFHRIVACWRIGPRSYSLGYSIFGITGGAHGCWPGYSYRAVAYDWPGHRESGWECR